MAMYNVNVQDIRLREHLIKERCKNPIRSERFHQYPVQGGTLPVINVDVGLPLYRMANWRTRTKQLEHIHREGLSHDYFQCGEEDVGPQRVQHEILIEFAKRGRGDKIVPIMQALMQDRRQTETLLVTSSGVVVNGNRRLAAMRELFAEDPGKYPFDPLEVAVLPAELTALDLKKIEFELQMQQETKLPYDWIIQCLSVKELADSGLSHQEIMHRARLSRVEDVQAMINRLNEAELYLSDYLKAPEDYAAVERQEQQFIELQKALQRKSDVGEKELARRMCYVITKHSRELETRAYDFKIAFGKETKEVAARLAERLNLELPGQSSAPTTSSAEAEDDVFSDDGEMSTTVRFEPVRKILSDPSRSKELADTIADICEEIKEEQRDEAGAKKPLNQVKRAKTILAGVDIDKAGDDTIDDIQSELGQVIELAKGLLQRTQDASAE